MTSPPVQFSAVSATVIVAVPVRHAHRLERSGLALPNAHQFTVTESATALTSFKPQGGSLRLPEHRRQPGSIVIPFYQESGQISLSGVLPQPDIRGDDYAALGRRFRDEFRVWAFQMVERVETENPELPCEAPEHGIHDEPGRVR